MKKTYAILGLGRFGISLIEELLNFDCNIIGIDNDSNNVENAARLIEQAYVADTTSEKAMKDLGVQNADNVVITFYRNFECIVMTFVTLQKLGVKNITVRVDDDKYVPVLKKIGVIDIISPVEMAGSKLGMRLACPNFTDYFEVKDDYCVVKLNVPEHFEAVTLKELDVRNRFGVNILMIAYEGETITPNADTEIKYKEELFVFGLRKMILKFADLLNDPKKIHLLKNKE